MMKFIEFDKDKCDNCFKCLRVCPTKAISFNKEERKIIDHLCIKCGLCQAQCPQEALQIKSTLTNIKSAIQSTKKVAVSIAPSYIGAFRMNQPEQMVAALKRLGFDIIEETAVGAEIISKNYEKAICKNDQPNVITSCCPSANYLIEHHYPELIPYMLPIVSPMVAHGRYIKKRYSDCYVVFIGPCLAKMAEAEDITGAIDAVITFEDLFEWLRSDGINLRELQPIPFDQNGTVRGKSFPLGANLKLPTDHCRNYRFKRVNGISQCEQLLKELKEGMLEGFCFEMNICDGSCMNGPEMPKLETQRFEREKLMLDHIDKIQSSQLVHTPLSGNEVLVNRTFTSKKVMKKSPDKDSIKEILIQTGKYSNQDELNCGACGYSSCKSKAEAVYYGHSDIYNCLAYLRGKAENMHSILIENSPNAVCTIDQSLRILEHNPSFNDIFNEMSIKMTGMPIYSFMDDALFIEAFTERKCIKGKKTYVKAIDRHLIINIIYHERENVLLCFFTDITPIEEKKKALEKVKQETLLKTQEVIDKQMRVAQEIASLLGETTAETKMSLKSLKDLVLNDEGGF